MLRVLALCVALAFHQDTPAPVAEGWDFIPGERTLLLDDFSDIPKGAAPPHWKVRGGSVRLDTAGRLSANVKSQLTPNVARWPKSFTIETEFVPTKVDNGDLNWWFEQAPGDWLVRLQLTLDATQECAVELIADASLGKHTCAYKEGKPNQLTLWFEEGRVRVYLNGERLIDVNQVDLSKMKYGFLELDPSEGGAFALARVRIAESAPDFSQTISASGRYVTHGILFDTGSDRIRQESAPVIQSIAKGLETNPSLKLLIEGHTDSVGNAAANLDLSRRRAEAVKGVLVAQFKIDAGRLSANGLGATKPIDSNDTPQGRAQNRRVELVKQ